MAAILWKHKPAAGPWKHLQRVLQSVLSGYIQNHAEKVCGKEIVVKLTFFIPIFNIVLTSSCRAFRTKLTLKHWETHGCVVSTVATDALVLKHQAISIHNAD